VTFLVDNRLPAALARFLASRGLDCRHVRDVDLADVSDAEIWEYASRNDCVLISKDDDCFYLANVPSARARLIGIRLGNCRTKALLQAIAILWSKIEASLNAGDRIIEVR